MPSAIEWVLGIAIFLTGLFLVVAVLMQSGKEEGLSGALAGGASESYLSKNKKGGLDAKLAASTKWIALAWIVLTLALSLV